MELGGELGPPDAPRDQASGPREAGVRPFNKWVLNSCNGPDSARPRSKIRTSSHPHGMHSLVGETIKTKRKIVAVINVTKDGYTCHDSI